MATKAELEAELAALKAELARDRAEAQANAATPAAPDDDGTATSRPEGLHQLLADNGIDVDSVEAFGSDLSKQLVALQKEQPIVVLIGAFALGCLVGRAFR